MTKDKKLIKKVDEDKKKKEKRYIDLTGKAILIKSDLKNR